MKRKKRTLLVVISVLVMIVCAQSSIAYFTSRDKTNNVFTLGEVAIELDEPSWDAQKVHSFQSGVEHAKDPEVHNTGKNDAYVRIRFSMSDAAAFEKHAPTGFDYLSMFNFSSNWQYSQGPIKQGDQVMYTFVYQPVLQVGAKSDPLFTKVTLPGFIDGDTIEEVDGDWDITVQADAIQAEGFENAAQAFAAYDSQVEVS